MISVRASTSNSFLMISLSTSYVKEVRVVDCTQVPNGAYNIMFYLK